MSYIDPIKYNLLIQNLTKEATKQPLKEGVVEKKELSPKQKKIAAAAPPPDRITGADFKALQSKKEEGMHLGQPTAPTTTTVEGKRDFSKLQPDERKQLKEYIQSMKTIKQEIKKLMEKAMMSEGGDTTGLVMPEASTDQVFSALAKAKVGMTDGSSKGFAVKIDGKANVWRGSEEAANAAAEKLKAVLPDSTIEVSPFPAIKEDDEINIAGDGAEDGGSDDELDSIISKAEEEDTMQRYVSAGPGREA